MRLARAVGDLGDLEIRIDRGAHAYQFALALKKVDIGAQVHGHLPVGSDVAAREAEDSARAEAPAPSAGDPS